MIFDVPEDVLNVIKSLQGDSRWIVYSRWISDLAIREAADLIHCIPDHADVNFTERYHMKRGLVVALDVLSGIHQNIDKLYEEHLQNIEDMKRLEENTKALNRGV